MPAWIVRVLLMFVLLLAAAGIAAPLSVGARFIGPLSEAAGCPVISVVPAEPPAETCGPGGPSTGALAQSTATSIPTPTTTPAPSSGPGVLWHADHETGDFSQWTANYGGGTYNSGNGVASISTDFAHSGSYSVALSLTTNGGDSEAVRIFR